MKIIFLDIDGVLNTPATWGKRPLTQGDALECELVQRVSDLVEVTGAKVVISSTWRMVMDLPTLKLLLYSRGFKKATQIIDITPHLGHRAKDIAAWLSTHRSLPVSPHRPDSPPAPIGGERDITAYVALDDDTACDGLNSLGKHWVQIDPAMGLQLADCEKALRILGPATALDRAA